MAEGPRRKASLAERFRYRFDIIMSKGATGQILLLGMVSLALFILIIVATIGLQYLLLGAVNRTGLVKLLADTFMLILVPDPVSLEEGQALYFLSSLTAIVAGLFVGGTLIGILSSAIDSKMDELRRGRSFVAEENHTVILGWSSKIFRIVSEIVIANENHPGLCIAVLADRDSVEMEEELRSRIGDFRGTHVVCRSGKPIVTQDLELVNLEAARSVVILSPEEKRDPDSHIIKILLTAAKLIRGRDSSLNVIVELLDRRNSEIAQIATKDSAVNVVSIHPEVLVPRLLIQSCRKRGLSNVYLELFDFDGDEIYFHKMNEFPRLVGKTFYDVVQAFDSSSIIGLVQQGRVLINPPFDTVCSIDDEVLSISEDDDTTIPSGMTVFDIDESAIVSGSGRTSKPEAERNLILGWNKYVFSVVSELDHYVSKGSKLTIASPLENMGDELSRHCPNLQNHEMEFLVGDTSDRRFLETLSLGEFDNILILPFNPEADDDREDIDAATIKCLVYVRDIARRNNFDISLTTQMLLDESRAVAEVNDLGDFVVGDEIIGRIIAQLAEESRLKEVFRILLTVEGSEIYLRPARDYVITGRPVNGYTLLEAARRRSEIFIGYVSDDGIFVNPAKSQKTAFAKDDKLIVVAEH